MAKKNQTIEFKRGDVALIKDVDLLQITSCRFEFIDAAGCAVLTGVFRTEISNITKIERSQPNSTKGTRGDLLSCSFCGKPQNDVRTLIAGPGVYICSECIVICDEIIADDAR